jgi:hypothetical protein
LQKPEALTTFCRADNINNIYHDINDLPPAIEGQLFLAESGQGRWLFH